MKNLLMILFLSLLFNSKALSKDLEYYCEDISSSPPNHIWFEDKGRLSITPIKGDKYNIIAGNTLFTEVIKANGDYSGEYKNKYYQISIGFTEKSKTGILVIVSEQNPSPVDIRFKCKKNSFWNSLFPIRTITK